MNETRTLVVGLVAVLLLVGGCGNSSGEGNEFSIVGRVTEIGSQSIQVEVVKVDSTSGKADGWFDDGRHRIHDNCNCHGLWNGRKRYGTVYDFSGDVITLDDLQGEECLHIDGKIRSQMEGKVLKWRPVFDRAQITPCG